jgi:hypothetical protein
MENNWILKYTPATFDHLYSNLSITKKIKNIALYNLNTHFILKGPIGCGKKTLVNIYLNYVDPDRTHTLCLNSTLAKNGSLNLFVDRKLEMNKKRYIIIHNLERFPTQFYFILYNLFSNPEITLIITETKETLNIEPWCLLFSLHARTSDNLVSIAKYICEIEKLDFDEENLRSIAIRSKMYVYPFIYMLQCYYLHMNSWFEFSDRVFPFDELLNDPCLKNRFITLIKLCNQGYSQNDIAISLYNHVYEQKNLKNKYDLKYLLELGDTIEKYSLCEYHKDYLIYSITKLWRLDNPTESINK